MSNLTTKEVTVHKSNGTTYVRTDYYRNGKRVAKPASVKAAEAKVAKTSKPKVAKPKVAKASKPKVAKPKASKPKVAKPKVTKASKPKTSKPKVAKPKVAKPKVAKPKTSKPKVTKVAKPKVAKVSKPKVAKDVSWYIEIPLRQGKTQWEKMPDSQATEEAYQMYKAKTPVPWKVDFAYMVDAHGNRVRRGARVASRPPRHLAPFSLKEVKPLKSTKGKWYLQRYVQGEDALSTVWDLMDSTDSAPLEAEYQAYLKDPALIHRGIVFKAMAYTGGQGLRREEGSRVIEGPSAEFRRLSKKAKRNLGEQVTWWVGSPEGWKKLVAPGIEAGYLAYLEGGYPRGGTYGEEIVDFEAKKRSDGWEIRRLDPYLTL